MEGEPEHAAFVEEGIDADDLPREVEKRVRKQRAVLVDDADLPDLVDDEQPAGPVASVCRMDRRRQALRDELQTDGDVTLGNLAPGGRCEARPQHEREHEPEKARDPSHDDSFSGRESVAWVPFPWTRRPGPPYTHICGGVAQTGNQDYERRKIKEG